MKISVLIPAFNEERNIESTLKGLRSFQKDFCKKRNLDLEVLVIDDGSSDGTYEKAMESKAMAIKLKKNLGKGGALREGLKKAQGDIIVFLDADLKETSKEVYKLIVPILEEDVDVTIAKFKPVAGKKGFGLVKALAFYGIKHFTGHSISSGLSGQRAFKRKVLENIGCIPEGFSLEVGMLIDILKKGFLVREVDADMQHDVTERDLKGFIHRAKQFVDILRVLIMKVGRRGTVA